MWIFMYMYILNFELIVCKLCMMISNVFLSLEHVLKRSGEENRKKLPEETYICNFESI